MFEIVFVAPCQDECECVEYSVYLQRVLGAIPKNDEKRLEATVTPRMRHRTFFINRFRQTARHVGSLSPGCGSLKSLLLYFTDGRSSK